MRAMITALGIGAAVLATSSPALAQQVCAERDAVTDRLKTKYGEHFAGGGLRNAKAIFEVWMSEEQGTWTILMTTPDGKSCVMASGTDWRDALPTTEPAGIPG